MTTATRNEAAERRDRFPCQECGRTVAAAEFHPYWYCVLYKGGVDPRELNPPPPTLAAERRATVDACREFIADFSAAWTGRHVQNRRALDRADLLAAFDERFLP